MTYFRSYDPATEGPTDHGELDGGGESLRHAGRVLAAARADARRCLAAAVREDPARVLGTRLTSIRLDEFVKTRILEIGVHGWIWRPRSGVSRG